MSDKIKGQSYKSEFNSSWGYSEDLRFIFRTAADLRVQVGNGTIELVGALLSSLGAAVSILKMATTNKEAKDELRTKYETLQKNFRLELVRLSRGKRTFSYDIIDECEKFQDFLMQQTQNVGLGFSLQRELGKKEQQSRAFGVD